MICFQSVLKTSLQRCHLNELILAWSSYLKTSWKYVNKNSITWWYVLKTSWRHLCKTSWRSLEDVLKTFSKHLIDVLKMSSKRLEDVLKMYDQDEYIGLDQDVLTKSWRCLLKTKKKDVFEASSSRWMFAGLCLH